MYVKVDLPAFVRRINTQRNDYYINFDNFQVNIGKIIKDEISRNHEKLLSKYFYTGKNSLLGNTIHECNFYLEVNDALPKIKKNKARIVMNMNYDNCVMSNLITLRISEKLNAKLKINWIVFLYLNILYYILF